MHWLQEAYLSEMMGLNQLDQLTVMLRTASVIDPSQMLTLKDMRNSLLKNITNLQKHLAVLQTVTTPTEEDQFACAIEDATSELKASLYIISCDIDGANFH